MYTPRWTSEIKKLMRMGWNSEDTGGKCFVSFKNFKINDKTMCIAVNEECIVLHSVPCDAIELHSEETEREVIYIGELRNCTHIIQELKDKFNLNDDQASDVFRAFRVYDKYNDLVKSEVIPAQKPGIELKQALEQFENAAYNLAVAWEQDGSQKLIENYPFNKDFQELLHEIINWCNTHSGGN